VYIGGFIQAAHIPSSRIPNIYDPEVPKTGPESRSPGVLLVKIRTIVRVISQQRAGVFTSAAGRRSCCDPG